MNPDLLINFTEGIRDASPNNRSVSTSGTVALVAGQFGDGGDFTDGLLQIPDAPALRLPADFTLEFWVNGSGEGTIWDKRISDDCPVPCGMPKPATKIQFKQIKIGQVTGIP